MTNVLVLEDCKVQRKSLVHMLLKTEFNLKIYEADNVNEALEICKNTYIDLFFVDIALNNSSGLDFALKIRSIEEYKLSWIIFTTTHINYMIQAFKEVHCYDYILKPYNPEKIMEITKIILENTPSKDCNYNNEKKVVFNNKGIDVIISTSDIIFLEVNIRNCIIHTKVGKLELSRVTLKKALELINETFILKSHKAFAININYITKIEKCSVTSWNVYFKDCEFIALIGLKYKQFIDDAINKFVI